MTDKNQLDDFLDFTDLRKKKSHARSSNYAESTNQDALDNEGLLRSFKELRQKLKSCQKENHQLKEEAKINGIRVRQNQQALELALTNNIELKDQLERQADANTELKKRFASMKEQIQRNSALQEELAFTKQALLEAKMKEKSMTTQQKKTMEMFIQERLEMEEELAKLRAKASSDEQFMRHLEQQATRSKQQNIRLQNHMRKLSISFQESNFTQQFQKDNFERSHLNDTIAQLQKQITLLRAKLSKQKQRRYLLEQQLIHLEEAAGINNVKAVTYEGQTEMLAKKQNKLERKVEDLSNKLERISLGKIAVEEQAIKYQMLTEEVVAKLKPLLTEDMVEILTYYEKKLKNTAYVEKQVEIENSTQPIKTPPSIIEEKMDRANQRFPLQEHNYLNLYSQTPYKGNKTHLNSYRSSKQDSAPTTTKFTFAEEKENQLEQVVLEGKIRREREEMEKKLKQKWFQKKFDCSMPSELYRLRADYINTFIDR